MQFRCSRAANAHGAGPNDILPNNKRRCSRSPPGAAPPPARQRAYVLV